MPDSTTLAIDRVFHLVDSFIEKTDYVFGRAKHTSDRHGRRAKTARRDVFDAARTVKVAKSTSTALARRQFNIVEALDATTGNPVFVVTNGNGAARVECNTRALAEKILLALETSP